jgi:hypothetical protein
MTPEAIQTALQPQLDRLSAKLAELRSRQPLPAAFQQSLDHKLIIELIHSIDQADQDRPIPFFQLILDCQESALDQYLDCD